MWFKLAGATFTNNLGTMDSISKSYMMDYSGLTGLSASPGSVSYATDSTPDATITFTVKSGYVFKSGSTVTASGGASRTYTASADIAAGSSFTMALTGISNKVTFVGVAELVSGGNPGDSEEPDVPVNPPSGGTEPADVLQLNAFRYDEDVTINSGGDTSTKTGYNTFYEIPVLPSSVYYIPGAVRVALLNSSKAYRNDYNIYTDSGSNVGQAFYVATDANTAFLNITVLESKCTIEDAKIQIAHITTTVKDTKTLASTGATLVTGKKLSSSSYTESADDNYIVYKDIPVTAGANYKIAGSARVWFLAEDKTTTKGSSVNPTTGGVPEKFCFKVPTGAAYASASIYKNNMDKSAEELELHELTVAYSV